MVSVEQRRYWFALHPDVPKPIGGVKQVHRLAEALIALGREAVLVQEQAAFHPGWFRSAVPAIGLEAFRHRRDLRPDRDVVVLPETFLSVLPRYAPGIPKLIFNQNGSYSFGLNASSQLPPATVLQLYRHPEVKAVLCVSEHDRRLLAGGLAGDPASVFRLFNAIETELFQPAQASKQRQIAYMPRKQSGQDVAIVQALLQAQPWFASWRLQPIQGLAQPQVAEILRQSVAFLAFSQREGFGLPLAEAVACGCYLIGHTGLGGAEVFALAAQQGTAQVVADGDWLAFVQALAQLDADLAAGALDLPTRLMQSSKQVRRRFSPQAMLHSVAEALPRWEALLAPES